ncbi:conjugal transfer protein TraI [Cnuella takakiae]|nr:conjugal transfer protein TraI [Cnuella takakiae]
MQNETLWLQNAQKALENTLSKTRLEEITGWVTKQRDLYQDYYDQLWRVKSAISLYAEIRELTRKQLRIVQAYKVAWAGVRKDQHFTVQELVYISDTYTGMLKQCLNNLQQVQSLVQSFTLEMTDGQRMGMISNIADDIDRNYSDLKAFNVRNVQISLSRARDEQELEVVRMIYGL